VGGVEICFQAKQRRWVPGREVWRGEADSIGEIHINLVLGMNASFDCALAAVQGNVYTTFRQKIVISLFIEYSTTSNI
jgi:hypothetical protein